MRRFRRQVNNCDGPSACRRATAHALSRQEKHSATIDAFVSSRQSRRRPAAVKTSKRCTPLVPGSSHGIVIAPTPATQSGHAGWALHFRPERWGCCGAYEQCTVSKSPISMCVACRCTLQVLSAARASARSIGTIEFRLPSGAPCRSLEPSFTMVFGRATRRRTIRRLEAQKLAQSPGQVSEGQR